MAVTGRPLRPNVCPEAKGVDDKMVISVALCGMRKHIVIILLLSVIFIILLT